MGKMKIIKQFKGMELNCSPKCRLGFYEPMLIRIEELMNYQCNSQYKTFMARFDLTFHNGADCSGVNNEISTFMNELTKAVQREVKKTKPKTAPSVKTFWKAECNNDHRNRHYHVIFTCNAKAFHSLNKLLQFATYYWNSQLDLDTNINFGLVNNSGSNGINGSVLLNTDQAKYNELFKWFSYLAKVEDLELPGKVYGSSQCLAAKGV